MLLFLLSLLFEVPTEMKDLIDTEFTHNKTQYMPSKIYNRLQRKCAKGQRKEVLLSQFNEQRAKAQRTQIISQSLRKPKAGMRMTPAS